MKMKITLGGRVYQVDLTRAESLAIKLDFGGAQPNHFGAAKAESKTLEGRGFVGDTRRGGSCNVSELRLVPHCNGTHTETAHHVCNQPFFVSDVLTQALFPATLVSLTPVAAEATDESYRPALEAEDKVITRSTLEVQLETVPDEFLRALIVRTLPNGDWKKSCVYGENYAPPFFTLDAAQYLVQRQVEHLLVDTPSVDRMYDDGKLSVHRVFWNLPQEGHEAGVQLWQQKTITEMVYIADHVTDGPYLLNLQTPAFDDDAAPSRPSIYPLMVD